MSYKKVNWNLLKPAVSKSLDFHEWNLIKVNSWNEEKTIEAVHWLIEEKLKCSHEEVYNNLSASVFYNNSIYFSMHFFNIY